MHMITVKEALKMRILFNCLLIQFVCMDISLGYDDISAYKPTKQGHDRQILDVAANVVDRSFSTCSTTGASNPSWWYVDLQKVKSIYDVEIYFRLYDTYLEQRQRERMYGYKLYISNSTDFSLLHQAYLCYNHTGPELPELNVTHVCVSFGRYVIFYNERIPGVTYPNNKRYTYTQLCEVIVQGCDRDDVYGPFCNNTCPINCQERRCYITNGTCAGCKDGWTGEKCHNACPAGFYGAECRKTCSDRCRDKTCHHVTGHCDGCRAGWMGLYCNEKCEFGTYDAGCLKLCSGNCFENKTCNKVHGECMDGCREGFKGTLCDETCEHGTFGPNCSGICSSHCVNRSCNHVTGSCDNGCNPGWRNDKCYEKCRDGTFGIMCKEECSGNCLNNETCYHVDGQCIHGCQTGFQGEKCDGPCDSGYFGEKCLQLCPVNCYDKCNNVNGLCKCKNGWIGRHCTEVCPRERYGEDCKQNCSGNCINNDTCHNINGYCLWGCRDGFRGKRCDRQNELVGFARTCMDEKSSVGGLTAGLVISFLLNVGLFFITLYLIWKKKFKKKADQPFYEISDREDSQQGTLPYGHVENHAYEDLNTTQSAHIYRNLSLNDNRTNIA
ncbi:multiple epidermal growth factor-like domains protein 10 isoform X6 [Saccostrea cucullata]|uniref:multiple epidermal growth factor-like domains protein 10 isoform X6 n=1 Tax=Saccostrea cuccullata TaxID=36930 RepID=UPI002ED0354A